MIDELFFLQIWTHFGCLELHLNTFTELDKELHELRIASNDSTLQMFFDCHCTVPHIRIERSFRAHSVRLG